MVEISVAPLMADAIKRIYHNEPVSPLFNNRFKRHPA